jgi:CubicO group peptidase (beta-lactamase class C family)
MGRKPQDRWTSFSVAKSVTSTLVGAAVQDGKLALDQPVTRYLPELRGSAYDGATVKDLITMSSGVKWNEDYTDPNSDVARFNNHKPEDGVDANVSYLRKLPRAALSSLPVAWGQAAFWTMIRCSSLKVVIDWPKMPTAS